MFIADENACSLRHSFFVGGSFQQCGFSFHAPLGALLNCDVGASSPNLWCLLAIWKRVQTLQHRAAESVVHVQMSTIQSCTERTATLHSGLPTPAPAEHIFAFYIRNFQCVNHVEIEQVEP
eukprot:COSAG02_NODE_9079_length_2339_cov_1.450000_4_plen_121_part_00